jgi:hypothetical protein
MSSIKIISFAFIPNVFRSVEYLGAYARDVRCAHVDICAKYPIIMSGLNQDEFID